MANFGHGITIKPLVQQQVFLQSVASKSLDSVTYGIYIRTPEMKTQGLFHDVIDCCMWRLFAPGLRACCLCLQKIACLLSFVALKFAKASYNIVFYFLMMKSNFSVT